MITAAYMLDVFSLDGSYRLLTRSPEDYNKHCLVSLGTGEVTDTMHGSEVLAYLNGKNPLKVPFGYVCNAKDIFMREWSNYPRDLADIRMSTQVFGPGTHIDMNINDIPKIGGE
jgi:hypothetical protein